MDKSGHRKKTEQVYDGKREGKLGTETRPARVCVQTEERMQEVSSLFREHGWKYEVDLDPDRPEDVLEMELLLNPQQPRIAEKKVGRNDPCPCGSGKKYKKCCGAKR